MTLKKVSIEFTDGVKFLAICNDHNITEGCLVLDLGRDGGKHTKVLPLCTLACIDFVPTDNERVYYGKA